MLDYGDLYFAAYYCFTDDKADSQEIFQIFDCVNFKLACTL